ncbi:MAG: hypothetical protein H6R11_519, partial [Proteobacteria bacterium]|nr:hypothetical protein [Pseudomonadota bacterium]
SGAMSRSSVRRGDLDEAEAVTDETKNGNPPAQA